MTGDLEQKSTQRVSGLGAVVLCGGKGTRLGIDKTQLQFDGQTFLERVVQQVSQVCFPVVLVGDTDFKAHRLPAGIFVDKDELVGQGPLEGIRVGLKRLAELDSNQAAGFAFVTSCDVPLLKPELIRFLFSNLEGKEAIVPLANDEAGRVYGMTAIYKTSLHRQIESRIEEGKLRVSELVSAFDSRSISVDQLKEIDPDLDSMTNINSAEDYFGLLKRFGQECPPELLAKLNSR